MKKKMRSRLAHTIVDVEAKRKWSHENDRVEVNHFYLYMCVQFIYFVPFHSVLLLLMREEIAAARHFQISFFSFRSHFSASFVVSVMRLKFHERRTDDRI